MEAVAPLREIHSLNTEIKVLRTDCNHLSEKIITIENCVNHLSETSQATVIRLNNIEKDVKTTNSILLWILGIGTSIGLSILGAIINMAIK